MAKQTLLTAAALILLTACNGPTVPHPAPPPQPEIQAEPPPPPLLGGPREKPADDGALLGGPYATADKPGPLTTFRRADGVEVTVMRPIPNPEAPATHRSRDGAHERLAAAPPPSAGPGVALAPTQPLPPPKVVEQPRPAVQTCRLRLP
jgi:hypothetical protein